MVLFVLLLLTLIDLVPSFTTLPTTTIKVSTLLLLRSFNHRYSKSFFVSSSKIGASSSQKSAVAVSIDEKCDTLITMESRKKAALYGLFVADATAMPVHWYYDVTRLRSDYGQIKGYVKPKDSFPGSIMNLSNTGGGGRGSDQGEIVGNVILHGKKKYWVRGGSYHYHLGLQAGENTLEAQLTRVLMRSMSEHGHHLDAKDFLDKYISFMTTPGSHNDTYASTCHRMFFANYVKGIPPNQCADNDGHNTDAIDALTLAVPVIVAYSEADRSERNAKISEVISLTRRTNVLQPYAEKYADILVDVLHGMDLRKAIEKHELSKSLLRAALDPRQSDPMVACYIDSSFPALLFLAYRYADGLESGILANANAGGENVARGSLLGALLGAQHGIEAFPSWTHALKDKSQIDAEINSLIR